MPYQKPVAMTETPAHQGMPQLSLDIMPDHSFVQKFLNFLIS